MVRNMNQTVKNPPNGSFGLILLFKGIVVSYMITIPAFMLFALILSNTDFPEKYISPAVVITSIISVLAAGSAATRGLKDKGWLNGSIVGLVYMLVLYLLSSMIFRNFAIGKYVITMTIIGILTGAIGGIIGINTKGGSKYKRMR